MAERTCNHCGAAVSSSGRRSESGIYYCSAIECQRQRSRDAYARRTGGQVGQAPLICSSCGTALPPRPVRWTDVPGHRWCNALACRRHRAGVIAQGSGHSVEDYESERTMMLQRTEYLHRALVLPRVECPECHREDAVDGYPHFDPYGERCAGTGDKWVHRDDVRATWPDFAGPPATLVLEPPRP